jgi:hypothetical protein
MGEAQGVAYHEQVNALGAQGVALVEVLKVIGEKGVRITPDIMASGGTGDGGGGGIGRKPDGGIGHSLTETRAAALNLTFPFI